MRRHTVDFLQDTANNEDLDPTYGTFFAGMPCDIIDKGGREVFRGNQLQAETTHLIQCRYVAGLKPNMVAKNVVTEEVYLITKIIDATGRDRYLIIEAIQEVDDEPAEAQNLNGIKHRFTVGTINQLITTPAAMSPSNGPTSPAIVNLQQINGSSQPINKRYLLAASTDHASGGNPAGIWFWWLRNPLSTQNITILNSGAAVLTHSDLVAAGGSPTQLEFPELTPIYDSNGDFAWLSLQAHADNYGNEQSQGEFTATNLTAPSWTENANNPIADDATSRYGTPGNGHTGYGTSFISDGLEYSFSLFGGGGTGYRAIWAREYGTKDKMHLLGLRTAGYLADKSYELHGSEIPTGTRVSSEKLFKFRDQTYMVAAAKDGSSSGGAVTSSRIVIARVELKKGRLYVRGQLQDLVVPTVSTWYAQSVLSPTVVDVSDTNNTFTLLFSGFADSGKAQYSIGSTQVTAC